MTRQIEISQSMIDSYDSDGAVLIKGLFHDWVDTMRAGIERNMSEPGPYASENLNQGESGRFFDDYCTGTGLQNLKKLSASLTWVAWLPN